ncbi:uncharacterized protein LOC117342681 [Pecten maximus]|uniref:uncharacterized protein LOC117342681 n=1 Tax=Pecten maximus TaxID=6579 RepID=UPI00145818C4|nr:uncharacterized protein LOC117342681 [Pecten maximus]
MKEDDQEKIVEDGQMIDDDQEKIVKAGQMIDDDQEKIVKDGQMKDDDQEKIVKDGQMMDDDQEKIVKDGQMKDDDQEKIVKDGQMMDDDQKKIVKDGQMKDDDQEMLVEDGELADDELERRSDYELERRSDYELERISNDELERRSDDELESITLTDGHDGNMSFRYDGNMVMLKENREAFSAVKEKPDLEQVMDSCSEDSNCSLIWPILSVNLRKTRILKRWQTNDSHKDSDSSVHDYDSDSRDPSYKPQKPDRLDDGETDASDHNDSSALTITKKRKVSADQDESDPEIDMACPKTDCVSAVSKKADGGRKYDKRQACFYCGGLFAKISSHLQNIHQDEAAVCAILAKSKHGDERKKMWQELRNKGNFHHNIKILTGSCVGNIIVDRRPAKEKGNDCFLPCPACLAFILKDDLWRHSKTCRFVHGQKDEKSIKKEATLLLHGSTSSSENEESKRFHQEVLEGMKKDKVFDMIIQDKLLVLLGSKLLIKNGRERAGNVRQKIREMGRLLQVLPKTVEQRSMSDFLTPEKFDAVVCGVKKLCVLEGETMRGCDKLQRPALALKVGHTLKKLAQIKVGQALRDQNEKERKDAESYLILHNDEWCERISSHAHNTLSERKFNNPDILPLTEDIVCLRKYLLNEMEKVRKELDKQPCSNTSMWRHLAQLTLCRVCVFNRRRGGEVGEMLLASYMERNTEQGSKELISCLEPIEKKLMERLQLVDILGKRKRKVPVILTEDMIKGLDCLNKHRAGVVVPTNKYLFAAPTTANGHLKGWDALNVVSEKAGLMKPRLMRTTNLRKYVATVSQIVDMGSNQELEWLASHMGHSLSVHREYYRLQEKTLELAKVSKLLMVVDKGLTHKYAGRRLDEITLDEIEDVPEEEPNQQDSEIEDVPEVEPNQQDSEIENVQVEPNQQDSEIEDVPDPEEEPNQQDSEPSLEKERKKKTRVPWTKADTEILKRIFHPCITSNKPPTKNDVLLGTRKNTYVKTMFEKRGWKCIKYYVWSLTQQHQKKKMKLLQASSLRN